ncbi:MAG: hypothetical protein V3V01_15150 [Acidimicrobiales bacterium]
MTHGLVEISAVHAGDVEVHGGVAVITGRVIGNVDVWGGRAIIPGIVEGNINNLGGMVRITGSVLGSITGSPAHTVVDITDRVTDPYGNWDPRKAARPAANPVITHARRPDLMAGRSSLVTALATAAVGLAIVGAIAVVGDNTDVDVPGVATVLVVDKPAG